MPGAAWRAAMQAASEVGSQQLLLGEHVPAATHISHPAAQQSLPAQTAWATHQGRGLRWPPLTTA